MAAIRFDCAVEMEGGATYTVTADQRDVARYECEDFYTLRKHSMLRYLAWAASTRQKLTELSWDDFSAQCVEVGDAKPDGDALDPGRPDPRTASSSKSSGGPAAE
jgi:hypothetical protein